MEPMRLVVENIMHILIIARMITNIITITIITIIVIITIRIIIIKIIIITITIMIRLAMSLEQRHLMAQR